MTEVKSYRESHLGQGSSYHELFTTNRHRIMMWNWERRILDNIRLRRFDSPPSHLDFACGTGRILAHFAPAVSASTGVDVSPSMLAVARRGMPSAEIIEADLTRQDVLGQRDFRLITAFRFFPNAEAELRQEVIGVLARHLSPQGILIFNNHLKFRSAAHLAEASIGQARKRRMRPSEVEAMVTSAGLQVLEVHRHGILPMTERFTPLPLFLLERTENLLGKASFLGGLAQNWIYVCGRAEASR